MIDLIHVLFSKIVFLEEIVKDYVEKKTIFNLIGYLMMLYLPAH